MRTAATWTVTLLMALAPSLSRAQTIDRHGAPSVACAADGSFVVVWHSRGQDGDGYGVIGQRFDSSGGARGTELLINSYTIDNQRAAAICSDSESRFVVVWQSYGQDDDGYGVFARRFDSAGTASAPEFQVANTNLYSQVEPDVACSGAGDFVVAWSSGNLSDYDYGIVARRFTSAGNAPSEFNVNTYTSTSQVAPSISVDAAGGFVVAWTSYENQDGDGYGVFGQRYASDGSPLGSEIQINTYTASNQLAPAVAADASGAFVVAWSSAQGLEPGYDVFGQRFASDGAPAGTEFQANTHTTGDQGVSFGSGRVVDVARGATEGFVIVWQSGALTPPSQDGDGSGVFGQRFAGSPPAAVGTEFRANTATAGDQAYPSVCATGSGSFVVVWESRGESVDGIFAQRYDSGGGALGPEIRVSSDTVRPPALCPGDCDGSLRVSVDELVTGVNIALSRRPAADCVALDTNGSDSVTVDELVTAVRAAIEGCSGPRTPTPPPTPTPEGPEDRTRRPA